MVYGSVKDGKNGIKGESFNHCISTTKTFQLMRTACGRKIQLFF